MTTQAKVEHLLGAIFDGARDGLKDEVSAEEYERRRHDFVFHMLDWQTDMKEFWEICQNPESFSEETASPMVIGYLYHVVPHLQAAGRLLLDEIPDTFAVSATETVSEGTR